MSKQKSIPQQPQPTMTPQQQAQRDTQQRMGQLQQIYKDPLRKMNSQKEELEMSALNELISNIVNGEQTNKNLSQEVLRLRKILDDNKIKHDAHPPVPNRAERRAADKKIRNSK